MSKLAALFIVLTAACRGVARKANAAPFPERIELAQGWRLISASRAAAPGTIISTAQYDAAKRYPVRRMPATVLEILEEDGVYPNLYFGVNMLKQAPQQLYLEDWWCRTRLRAPANAPVDWLEFPGINYWADIWLNGHELATSRLHNPTNHGAFFERATTTSSKNGEEILPIEYDDKEITVFPHATTVVHGTVRDGDWTPAWVTVSGNNTAEEAELIR